MGINTSLSLEDIQRVFGICDDEEYLWCINMTEDEIKEMQETNNAFVASLTPEVFNNSRISLVD